MDTWNAAGGEAHVRLELSHAVAKFLEATEIDPALSALKMHATVAAMHNVCAAIEGACQLLPRPLIDEIIQPAFDLHRHAPFVRRLQDWPRGYPGDFETIEWLVDGRPRIDVSNKYFWIEWYALNTAIAQQHRNKIEFQRESIFERLTEGSRILSVGCGGARDMAGSVPKPENIQVTLIDIDSDALILAKTRTEWAVETEAINGDALRVMRALAPGYHRIVFGGLFDYFNDRVVTLILKLASRLAAPNGCKLTFTNVSTFSTFGTWIENMARWPLILRSEYDVQRILTGAGIDPKCLSVTRDTTGLSLMCEVDI